MYKLSFYVPESHLDTVQQALFQKGAGRIGNYDCCSWHTRGTGQFRPLQGADPFLGEEKKLNRVDEYKVEMVVKDALLQDVLEALVKSHPYEEPAYHAVKIMTLNNRGKGHDL